MDVTTAKLKTKQKADEATDDVKPWVRGFARFGYFAKGTVYILVGVLSMMAAAGVGGKKTGTTGAFASVARKPFGEILLWIVSIGLAGYVMWRIIQVFLDPDNKGGGMQGWLVRICYLASAIAYSAVAFKAFKIALHAGTTSKSKQTLVAKLLSQSYGPWIIGIIGVILIGFAIFQICNGYSERFMRKFKTYEMSSNEITVNRKVGKIGLIARGITFLILGYFIIKTAVNADAYTVIGLDGALAKISQQPFGQFLLGAVAIGLFLYGLFQWMKGKNRHMKVV